ncbi:hypothetical protein LX36DRAFT_726800, partial [Colletotrichum falcatum]
ERRGRPGDWNNTPFTLNNISFTLDNIAASASDEPIDDEQQHTQAHDEKEPGRIRHVSRRDGAQGREAGSRRPRAQPHRGGQGPAREIKGRPPGARRSCPKRQEEDGMGARFCERQPGRPRPHGVCQIPQLARGREGGDENLCGCCRRVVRCRGEVAKDDVGVWYPAKDGASRRRRPKTTA